MLLNKEKETGVKFNPIARLSAYRPSNDWIFPPTERNCGNPLIAHSYRVPDKRP